MLASSFGLDIILNMKFFLDLRRSDRVAFIYIHSCAQIYSS
jgi:hypothetical protein